MSLIQHLAIVAAPRYIRGTVHYTSWNGAKCISCRESKDTR